MGVPAAGDHLRGLVRAVRRRLQRLRRPAGHPQSRPAAATPRRPRCRRPTSRTRSPPRRRSRTTSRRGSARQGVPGDRRRGDEREAGQAPRRRTTTKAVAAFVKASTLKKNDSRRPEGARRRLRGAGSALQTQMTALQNEASLVQAGELAGESTLLPSGLNTPDAVSAAARRDHRAGDRDPGAGHAAADRGGQGDRGRLQDLEGADRREPKDDRRSGSSSRARR